MNQLFFVLIIIAFICFFKYIEYATKNKRTALVYKKRDYLMTKAELEFFRVLESIIKNQYYIIPQLSISKIAAVTKGKNYHTYLNKIDRKTVDFVLFDKEYFSPIMVIELDDSSHNSENRRMRDDFVDNVMEKIGLKIIHIKTAYTYNEEELANLIFRIKNNNTEE